MATIQVKSGDTLSKIGKQSGIPWQKIYDANKGIIGSNPNLIKPGQVLTIPSSTPAPIAPTASQEKPAGDLAGTLPSATPQSPISNLRLALREALNEAGMKRQQKSLETLQPLVSGATPGSFAGIVNLVRSQAATPAEAIFEDVTKTVDFQQELALKQKEQYLDTFKVLSDSGAMLNMGNDSLMVLEQQAGLPQGTALAWKTRLEATKKMDDEMAQLEVKKLQEEIGATKALATQRSSRGGGSSSSISGNINLTPEDKRVASALGINKFSIDFQNKLLNGGYSKEEIQEFVRTYNITQSQVNMTLDPDIFFENFIKQFSSQGGFSPMF